MADNKNRTTVNRATRFANAKNPWLGLGSYHEGQQLYGRNKETADLTDIIVHHTASVVYGKSGIGKSSLLRAGVFPQLRQNGLVPIYLRLAHNTEVPYVQQMENVIAENVALKDLLPNDIPDMGLWDFFHRHQFFDSDGSPVTPVIVLDQFEEIFTLTQVEHKTDVQAFFTELADVLNDVKPDRVIEAEVANNKQTAQPHTMTSRSGFVLQSLSRATLKYEKSPSFRIVFSLRDDSLYLLERSSAKIPALKTNRYNLRALDEQSALDVIMKPCPELFTEKEAREILDGLAYYEYDDYRVVDPAILSLFLYTYYQEQGKVSYSDIFGRYYKECTKDIQDSSIAYIEDHLLTERGNRNQIPFDDIIAAGVAQGELELLLQRKILKTEKRKGHDYAEFSHDRLCEQALKHREERKLREQARKMRKRMMMIAFASAIIVGVFTFLFWQNSRYLMAQKQKESIERLNDSISQLNASLSSQNLFLANNNDSISKLNISLANNKDSISKLNQSLSKQVHLIKMQRDTLENTLVAKIKAEKNLHEQIKITEAKNSALIEEMKLKEKQEYAIKSIQGMALYNSCIGMRNAVEGKKMSDLIIANNSFKSCPTHFWGLRCMSKVDLSFNGHFIFSPVFVDSLIAHGDRIYRNSDYYNKLQYYQGAVDESEGVYYQTCIVGGYSSVKYTFSSRGHQELAFVTEPKGQIGICVYDKTQNKNYNYEIGFPYKFITFELPEDKQSVLEIEVFNQTSVDISFVIISNYYELEFR